MDTLLLLLKALIALAPVFALLFILDRLDAFDLITYSDIAVLIAVGGVLAIVSYFAGVGATEAGLTFQTYSRFAAPAVEELLKALPIIFLFARNRLGFKVDAAIAGFAVGAGFSMVESGWYLSVLEGANVSAWIVRGFGTAIMHGGVTALFAIISHEMTERQAEARAAHYRFNALLFLPGLIVAIALHALFNLLEPMPLVAMGATLLLIPATIFFALARNDRATREWLAADHAAHTQMLSEIRAGQFAESARGHAVKAAAAHLGSKKAVVDVVAYAELKTELILRAEELILAAQAGAPAEIGEGEREKFKRLRDLERKLGRTAVATIGAQLGFTRNDLWELSQLRKRAFAG
jgi:RsiW-degrading membrane proteinase PrsW (M82 family)